MFLAELCERRKQDMQITDIKIRKMFNDSLPMKAIVSVTFDQQLAVHDIKVIYAKDKHFIVMPSKQKSDDTYHDIVHPINKEFRQTVEDAILAQYFKALEELNDESNDSDDSL